MQLGLIGFGRKPPVRYRALNSEKQTLRWIRALAADDAEQTSAGLTRHRKSRHSLFHREADRESVEQTLSAIRCYALGTRYPGEIPQFIARGRIANSKFPPNQPHHCA